MYRSFRFAIAALCTVATLLAPRAVAARPVPLGAGPIVAETSVLVVGGTPAGVAAALAAARRGERVTLTSARGELGGVLTSAMMDQWDLNLAPDGSPIEHGIFDEIYGRLGQAFTPDSAAANLAALVAAEPRIRVRLGELPVSVATASSPQGMRVESVTFRDVHTGAVSIERAPYVVDATDFADVASLAGARYDVGRQDTGIDERMQAVTLMFTFAGVDWPLLAASYDARRFGPGGVGERTAWGYSRLLRRYRPLSKDVFVRDLNLGRLPDGALSVNAIDVWGVDGRDRRALDGARRATVLEANHLADYLRTRVPGFANVRVGRFAQDVYVRETRHVAGLARLTSDDVWLGRIPSDTIGLSSYPIDVHAVDPQDAQVFAPVRHVYGIPFGAMVPRGFANVVLASPAISASHLAAGSARVIPTTIEEGEAAGAACALARETHASFAEIDREPAAMRRLRASLATGGVLTDLPRRTAARRAKPAPARGVAER